MPRRPGFMHPRDESEAAALADLLAATGIEIGNAILRSRVTTVDLSGALYGGRSQHQLINRTIKGELTPFLITLLRYALATGHTLEINLVPPEAGAAKIEDLDELLAALEEKNARDYAAHLHNLRGGRLEGTPYKKVYSPAQRRKWYEKARGEKRLPQENAGRKVGVKNKRGKKADE